MQKVSKWFKCLIWLCKILQNWYDLVWSCIWKIFKCFGNQGKSKEDRKKKGRCRRTASRPAQQSAQSHPRPTMTSRRHRKRAELRRACRGGVDVAGIDPARAGTHGGAPAADGAASSGSPERRLRHVDAAEEVGARRDRKSVV